MYEEIPLLTASNFPLSGYQVLHVPRPLHHWRRNPQQPPREQHNLVQHANHLRARENHFSRPQHHNRGPSQRAHHSLSTHPRRQAQRSHRLRPPRRLRPAALTLLLARPQQTGAAIHALPCHLHARENDGLVDHHHRSRGYECETGASGAEYGG